MTCPHCKVQLDMLSHGRCQKCKQYCGCSFNPTSDSDWCKYHRRQMQRVTRALQGK